MSNTLLPCPFCGGEAEIVGGPENWTPTFYDPDGGGDPIAVVCKTCACGLHFFDGYAEAIAAWNRRAQSDNEPLTLDADEVVRIDEAVKALHRLSVLLVTPDSIVCREAADLIESLQAQLAESQRRCAEEKCNT